MNNHVPQAHYHDLMGQVIYPQDADNDTPGTSSSGNQGLELPQNASFRHVISRGFRVKEDRGGPMETAHRFESLLSKIAKLRWQPSPAEGCRQWPKNLTNCLKNEFQLSPEDMESLQWVTLSGSFGGFSVSVVRIFNHVEAQKSGLTVSDYHDLDEHPEMIVFEGYVFEDGPVHLRQKESLITI